MLLILHIFLVSVFVLGKDQLTFYSAVEFSKDGEKFKKEFDNCKNLSDAYEQVRKYVEKVCK